MAQSEYSFDNISIYHDEHAVHIKMDQHLLSYLEQPGIGALALSDHVLLKHQQIFGSPLDISRHSLAIEILGHVYADSAAFRLHANAQSQSGQEAAMMVDYTSHILGRTSVIDCGEGAVDTNRRLWDALVPFRKLIYAAVDS